MRRSLRVASLASALFAAACTPPIPEGQLVCTDARTDCPGGWVCAGGLCYSEPRDASLADAGPRDATMDDGGIRDAPSSDTGTADAATPDAGGVPVGVTASELHTCAWTSTGRGFCWGDRSVGQLGDDTTSPATPHTRAVAFLASETIVQMAAGSNHTCALLEGGAVECAGANVEGSLGDGGGSTLEAAPVTAALGAVSATHIASGAAHTCAALDDGTVRCWGRNDAGQVGNGSTSNAPTPMAATGLSGIVSVACGIAHSCALDGAGTVFCWGGNGQGQLGSAALGKGGSSAVPVEADGAGTAIALTAGGDHTCTALDDGRVACWGANVTFQLGDDVMAGPTPHVVTLPGGLSPTGLTANGYRPLFIPYGTTCAFTPGESAVCFGVNYSAQLGIGRGSFRETPTQVTVVGAVSAVAAGARHGCAVAAGAVRCWGSNERGQLGDTTTTDRPTTAVTVVGI